MKTISTAYKIAAGIGLALGTGLTAGAAIGYSLGAQGRKDMTETEYYIQNHARAEVRCTQPFLLNSDTLSSAFSPASVQFRKNKIYIYGDSAHGHKTDDMPWAKPAYCVVSLEK